MQECIRPGAARRQGSLAVVRGAVRGDREVEGGRVRWGNREAEEVYLRYLEGNQEVVAGLGGCGVIWMLPGHVISARQASNGCDLLVLPGGDHRA